MRDSIPPAIGEARRDDVETFIELHIEQGPYLEREDIPVGIVERITGYRQYLVTLEGAANHAGTTPMDLRRDPMAGAAEIISGVINTAHRMGRPCVTTVGRIIVSPNERAVIPRQVAFTVDARSPDPAQRELLLARHEALIDEVAQRRDLSVTLRIDSDRPPVACDPDVVAAIAAAAAEAGVPAITMTSGAVHDTMQLAEIAKIAMIFVRSRGGISHSPEEFTSADDAAAGTEVLARTLHALAYRLVSVATRASDRVVVMLTSPLEPEHVERIAGAFPDRVDLIFRPDLMPAPRYVADHGDPAWRRNPDQEREWHRLLGQAEVLLDFPPYEPRPLLELAPKLRWVQTTSAGVGPLVQRLGLQDSHLLVTTASGIHAQPLAEFVFAALLYHTKEIGRLQEEQRAHQWHRFAGIELAGQTMAIIGPGRIGREIARIARAFRMRVVALGRDSDPARAGSLGVDRLYSRERAARDAG